MAGKKVIIRTLDIGADKQADYLNLGKEENPALGYRAIRICLTQTDIFRNSAPCDFQSFQLRADCNYVSNDHICRRSGRRFRKIVQEVKKELRDCDIPYKDVEKGNH